MKSKKRILSVVLAGALSLGMMPGMTMTTVAGEPENTYTLTIPSTLNVGSSGWNATSGISATGTLASGKKLTVTATSGDEFALVSGENKVTYTLAAENGGAETTSWEFDSLSSTATTKPMGIIVEDYSTMPAGTYQDTVTFTASIVSTLTYIEVEEEKPNAENYLHNVRFYYIPGETYRQAVENHGRENGTEWRIDRDVFIYWGEQLGNLLINGDMFFHEGGGTCSLTLDSVVDPEQTYTHNIMLWVPASEPGNPGAP